MGKVVRYIWAGFILLMVAGGVMLATMNIPAPTKTVHEKITLDE